MKRSLVSVLICLAAPPQIAAPGRFADDFSAFQEGTCLQEGRRFGEWSVDFSGYGCVRIEHGGKAKWLETAAAPSAAPAETHAVFVSGPFVEAPLAYHAKLATVRQLRTGSRANPWEVGWLVWAYRDNAHFYYFVPRQDGWELGKRDPAYAPSGQRTLSSGSRPRFPLGVWHSVRVVHSSRDRISVYANGRRIASIVDRERPYRDGRVGFYSEDARARYTDVVVSGAFRKGPARSAK
ncbi:MAG: calcium-binding protein [Elusimicrobia bacterium]|nr:calcium-binding protein [Elusimicrobiota bacterium]